MVTRCPTLHRFQKSNHRRTRTFLKVDFSLYYGEKRDGYHLGDVFNASQTGQTQPGWMQVNGQCHVCLCVKQVTKCRFRQNIMEKEILFRHD